MSNFSDVWRVELPHYIVFDALRIPVDYSLADIDMASILSSVIQVSPFLSRYGKRFPDIVCLCASAFPSNDRVVRAIDNRP